MKILIFDNYDSFTHNLYHLIEKVSDFEIEVHRNDRISQEEINKFDKIVISPGPGIPKKSGILLEMIKQQAPSKAILGICLGHQAIAEAFGGSLINLEMVYHGVSTEVEVIVEDDIFRNIPAKFQVGRYHSWVVDLEKFPSDLEVLALDPRKNIMAMRHKKFNIKSLQFHPESILTQYGETIIKNWLDN